MLVVPVSIHIELYQVYKHNQEHWDSQNLVVVSYKPPHPEHPCKNAFLTSSYLKFHPLDNEMANTVLIVAALTTGLKVSS
jgi:hypothetical protein